MAIERPHRYMAMANVLAMTMVVFAAIVNMSH